MALLTVYKRPKVSDNTRHVITAMVLGSAGDGDHIALEVPRNALVTVKAVDINTAYTGGSTGTLTVGTKHVGGSLVVDSLADDTLCASEVTGTKQINKTVFFPAGGVITLGVTKGTSVANIKARLFASYSIVCV